MKQSAIFISLLIFSSFQQGDLLYESSSFKIFKTKAVFEGREIYDAEKSLQHLVTEEATEDCVVDYNFYYNPLSLIGDYYSY